MSFANDLPQDMRIADGSETVTVILVRETRIEIASVMFCLRRVLARPHAYFDGMHLQDDEINWNIPASQLEGHELMPGDEIQDAAGATFVIIACRLQTMGTRWLCACRKRGGTA